MFSVLIKIGIAIPQQRFSHFIIERYAKAGFIRHLYPAVFNKRFSAHAQIFPPANITTVEFQKQDNLACFRLSAFEIVGDTAL